MLCSRVESHRMSAQADSNERNRLFNIEKKLCDIDIKLDKVTALVQCVLDLLQEEPAAKIVLKLGTPVPQSQNLKEN